MNCVRIKQLHLSIYVSESEYTQANGRMTTCE